MKFTKIVFLLVFLLNGVCLQAMRGGFQNGKNSQGPRGRKSALLREERENKRKNVIERYKNKPHRVQQLDQSSTSRKSLWKEAETRAIKDTSRKLQNPTDCSHFYSKADKMKEESDRKVYNAQSFTKMKMTCAGIGSVTSLGIALLYTTPEADLKDYTVQFGALCSLACFLSIFTDEAKKL
ncbi:hypothetical protein KBC04_04795 [Candidatus Babeliales bacterium]|nr:hypothetical protein [Candidatus Babeliales bacterium]MBP9844350.1 hypothetical protein [Candidatus Babeliales bacterium]